MMSLERGIPQALLHRFSDEMEACEILHPATDEGLVAFESLSNIASKNGLFDHGLDEG